MRSTILDNARRLTLENGAVPSLNALAEAAGVSKGGLTHHFPSRAALVAGLAREALDEVDAAMVEASAAGRAARAWIELSLPSSDERAVLQALALSFRATDPAAQSLLADAAAAIDRWENMIAAEVGSVTQARVIRLVGDALVANALVGLDSSDTDVPALLRFLISDRASA